MPLLSLVALPPPPLPPFASAVVMTDLASMFDLDFLGDSLMLVFRLLEVTVVVDEGGLVMASAKVVGDTQSSGSQSRNPLANGLLAIFN